MRINAGADASSSPCDHVGPARGSFGTFRAHLIDSPMTKDQEILRLKERVLAPEKELEFLKTFPALARGRAGEILVAQLTGGVRTGYADPCDVIVKNGHRLEVKYSHLNSPGHSKTRRWNWFNLLGRSDTKQYEWLVLAGEKDPRYEVQYPSDLPYVFFLVPRRDVDNIKSSGKLSIALNTNLETARARQSHALKRHFVCSGATFKDLLDNVAAP